MTLLAQLPDATQLQAQFNPIVGGGDKGGIAGALALLSRFDQGTLRADLEKGVGSDMTLRVDTDPRTAIRAAMDVAGPALEGAIGDLSTLLAPLSDAIDTLQTTRRTTGSDFAAVLSTGITALEQALGATDKRALQDLIAAQIAPLDAVRAEFTLGGFGSLRDWGTRLVALQAEIDPLLNKQPADAAAALTDFFAKRLEKLSHSIAGPSLNFDLDFTSLGNAHLRVGELTSQIESAFAAAASAFDAGSPVNRTEFNAACALFAELIALIDKIDAWLTAGLRRMPDISALKKIVAERLAAAEAIEIIDFANLGDALAGPVAKVESLIDKLDFDAILKPLVDALALTETGLASAKLPNLSAALAPALSAIDEAVGKLEASWLDTIVLLKAAISQAVDKLKSALSSVGTWNEDGTFELAFAGQIAGFMAELEGTLIENVLPALDRLAAELEETLGAAVGAIERAVEAIPNLANEIQGTLSSAASELKELDLPGRIATAREQLDSALASLGSLELDPIVDPVIAELEELRDTIAQLDFSAMGEIQLGALKVSANVITAIDFKTNISDAIIAEIDEVVAIPRRALDAITAKIEDALSRLKLLSPDIILEPLEKPLTQLKEALGILSLDGIAAPVAEWREKTLAGLDALSPATLLAPVTALAAELLAKIEAISLEALTKKVGDLLDSAVAPLVTEDLAKPLHALSQTLDMVKAQIDAISFDEVIAPLKDQHQAIVQAVEDFGPEKLLAPFSTLFRNLTAPLAALTDDMAAQIGAAVAALKSAIECLDSAKAIEALSAALGQAGEIVRAVDITSTMARLRASHGELRAAFEAHAGPADVDLKLRVDGLNPLQSAAMAKFLERARNIEARIAELQKAGTSESKDFAELHEKLARLAPSWAAGNLDAARLRAAIASADPLGLAPRLEGIHARLKSKVMALDPSKLDGAIAAAKAAVKSQLDAIDLAPVAEHLSNIPKRIVDAVGAIEKNLLAEEAAPAIDTLLSVARALDPTVLILRLEATHRLLRDRLAAMDPLKVLEPLEAVLDRVRVAAEALNLNFLREPIAVVFAEIAAMVEALNIADILTPLNDLLEQLRSELEEALRRAEAAFNGLLGALPK